MNHWSRIAIRAWYLTAIHVVGSERLVSGFRGVCKARCENARPATKPLNQQALKPAWLPPSQRSASVHLASVLH